MNQHVRQPRPATQAAEGLPRWRWTTAEVERLAALGAFAPEDRFELIGGEIVPMSPKGRRHEIVADELDQYWRPLVTPDVRVSTERQFNLDDATYTDPDLMVRPTDIKVYDVRGPTALLLVEVADTSLAYDRTRKAALYASFGVREYWVIDANTLETRVHRTPGPSGYADVRDLVGTDTVVPLLAPSLSVRLADLDLG
jgi:Uma2 family endonuclease